MSDDLVSIVILSKNSGETMRQSLESLRAQTYPNIEIIVVDNHSTDNSVEIAEELAHRVISCGPERSPQANIGANAGNGEWVYIAGSDFTFEPTLIEEAVTRANAENADAVIIHNNSDATVSRWARARAFERSMYKGDDLNIAARFVRRELYLQLGGFDESLIAGEDYDLHVRLVAYGAKFARADASELHLGEPKTIKEVIKKHYFYGGDLRKYIAKHGSHAKRQLSPIRPAFLRNYREFIKHPGETANLGVYMVAKYAAGGAGWVFGGRGMKHAPTGSLAHEGSNKSKIGS